MYHTPCVRFEMSRVALVVVGNSILEGRLRNIMSRRGWSVEICQDGDKAVDEYVRLEPELVFLTLDLPTMDGHIAALEMRETDPKARIIFVSSKTRLSKTQDAAYSSGAVLTLVTPVAFSDIDENIIVQLQYNFDYPTDTSNPITKSISPTSLLPEYLSKEDEVHFNEVQQRLDDLNIPFSLDTNLVRGLDYYTRTTFEIVSSKLGAQDALCGGGRYDKLVESLGGKATPAVGFAAGFERILLAMDNDNELVEKNIKKIYLIGLGDKVRSTMTKILGQIRNEGFYIEFDPLRRSIKSQLRESNKLGSSITIILGEKEMEEQCVQIKDLSNGNQQSVPFDSIIECSLKLNT